MRSLLAIVLLVPLSSLASFAQGTSEVDTESKLIALEKVAKQQACENKDIAALNDLFDPAFVYVDQDGALLTKGDVLAYVQAAVSFHYVPETMTVRLHGDTAIVTGTYRMTSVERGKQLVLRGRFVDTWRFTHGRWIAIASLSTPAG